jgi:hypothetical protein
MWLKMYLGDLYVDKVDVDFNEMDTAKERQRHLERLATGLYEENRIEIIGSGISPSFYFHMYSDMNLNGFYPGSWKEIIEQVGGKQAKNNIEELSKKLAFEKNIEV